MIATADSNDTVHHEKLQQGNIHIVCTYIYNSTDLLPDLRSRNLKQKEHLAVTASNFLDFIALTILRFKNSQGLAGVSIDIGNFLNCKNYVNCIYICVCTDIILSTVSFDTHTHIHTYTHTHSHTHGLSIKLPIPMYIKNIL